MQSPHSNVFNARVTKPVFGTTGGSVHAQEVSMVGKALLRAIALVSIFLISIQLD